MNGLHICLIVHLAYMPRISDDFGFGPAVDALLEHLKRNVRPHKDVRLVGLRLPVLSGWIQLAPDSEPVPSVEQPGSRPGVTVHANIATGEADGFFWRVEGVAEYELESFRDVDWPRFCSPEELVDARRRWPWAFPDGLLPAGYQVQLTDLDSNRYFRVADAKPIVLQWRLSICKNPAYPSRGPSLTVRFTHASSPDRLLQRQGYLSMTSVPRKPLSRDAAMKLRWWISRHPPKDQRCLFLQHFHEVRELLHVEGHHLKAPGRGNWKVLYETRQAEPDGDLPVIVLDTKRSPNRESLNAQLYLFALKNRTLGEEIESAAREYLLAYVRKTARLSKRSNSRDDEVAGDVVTKLLEHYDGQGRSAASFDGYIRKVGKSIGRAAKGDISTIDLIAHESHSVRRARGKPTQSSGPRGGGAQTIRSDDVAKACKLSRRQIYKLADAGVIGKRTVSRRSYESAGGRRVVDSRNEFEFTRMDVEFVRRLCKEKQKRQALVALRAKLSGSEKRAAERWVKRRLDGGQRLDSIIDEVKARHPDAMRSMRRDEDE